VDALPPEKFHRLYSGGMWRRYRRDHLDLINQLLVTSGTIPSSMLQELSQLSITHETAAVREVILDLFADAATGMFATREYESAAPFFGLLIKQVNRRAPLKLSNGGEREQMMQWLSIDDPLRIAEDPECAYGRPTGFVS
jgi:hypothetical protein